MELLTAIILACQISTSSQYLLGTMSQQFKCQKDLITCVESKYDRIYTNLRMRQQFKILSDCILEKK